MSRLKASGVRRRDLDDRASAAIEAALAEPTANNVVSITLSRDRRIRPGRWPAPEPDPVRYPQWFTTAYFHRPEELVAEVRRAGFDAVSLHGIEGPGWLMQEHWPDPDRREQMLFAARAVETEPSLSGLSAHLLAVGTKP